MAVHQCAHFCNNPCLVHKQSFRCITKYLLIMSTCVDLLYINQQFTTHGVVYMTDIEKGIKYDVDADFANR